MITQEKLKSVLEYNPEDGVFYYLVSKGRMKAGSKAGSRNGQGYAQLTIEGMSYRANRLAYLYMVGEWPTLEIGYLDGNKSNIKWRNLIHQSHSESCKKS